MSDGCGAGPTAAVDRVAVLAARWAAVQDRVAAAARAAGRPAGDVTVLAVTKTFPASDVAALLSLGATAVGENRADELAAKAAQWPAGAGPCWHFIGQLQSNKARRVAGLAAVVQTVDRTSLLTALAAGADSRLATGLGPLRVLVQVRLDDDPRRGGAAAEEVPQLAAAVAAAPGLHLGGVMAVAPLGAPARPAFARLRAVADRLRADHPEAVTISAGMSTDLEDAVAEGATLVRVGTALLGGRAPLLG